MAMTPADRETFRCVLAGVVAAVGLAHACLSKTEARAAGRWALVAVAAGLASWLVLAGSVLLHYHVSGGLMTWSLGLFAGFELMAIRAGYQALPTRAGRWALAASAWPLVVLVVAFVVRLLKSVAGGVAV